jgi:hypothetical protein
VQLEWCNTRSIYEGLSKSFRTGRLEREMRMVQLSATTRSSIASLWVSLVSFTAITLCVKSRESSASIALGYRLEDRGSRVRFPAGLGIFLFTTASRTALGSTQPPIQWVPGALSLGVKRPGREADHSPPLVPRSKNAWNYTSTPSIPLHGVVLS